MGFSSGAIKAGEAYVEVNAKDNTRRGVGGIISGVGRKLKSAASGAANVAMLGAGLGVAAGAAAIGAAFAFGKFGDTIDKVSKRTGVSAEAISQLKFAAEQSGADLPTVEKGFNGLSRAIYDAGQGSKEAVDAFDKLGISQAELQGLKPEDQFKKVAAALSGVEDASLKGALAQKLLGKSGRQLIPMFDDLEALMKEADDLGLTISQEDAANAAKFSDEIARLTSQLKAFALQIGAVVAPALTSLSEMVRGTFSYINEISGDVFGDILAALKSGEFGLAAELAFEGIKHAFYSGLGEIFANWQETFKAMISYAFKSLAQVTQGILQFSQTASGGLIAFAGGLSIPDDIKQSMITALSAASAAAGATSVGAEQKFKDMEEAALAAVDNIQANLTAGEMEAEDRIKRLKREVESLKNAPALEPPKIPPEDLDAIEKKLSAVGTFSAEAASRIGTSGENKLEKNTGQTVKTLAEIERLLSKISQRGGLAFT